MEGIALLESGDYEGAVAQFEALIQQAGRVTEFELDLLKYRAEAEFCLGDFAAAAYTWEILSQVDTPKAEYCYLKALNLAKSGDVEEAKEAVEAGRKLDPSFEAFGYEQAMLSLADAYWETGEDGLADGICEELAAMGKAGSALYNRRAFHAMEAGDYETAAALCERGLAQEDEEAKKELFFHQAVCYEYLGQYEKALELFRAYVGRYGDDAQAAHEIAFLETR